MKNKPAPMRPTITFKVKDNANKPRSECVQFQD